MTVAVAVGLGVCVLALIAFLYRSLTASADDVAANRVREIAGQLRFDRPAELDRSLLATDRNLTVVQIIGAEDRIVGTSTDGPGDPLTALRPEPGRIVRNAGPVAADTGLRLTVAGVDGSGGRYTVVVAMNHDSIEDTIKLVLSMVGIGVPFVIAIAAGSTYLLVGRSLSSVETIRRRVEAITSADLTERVPVPEQHDEIAALARTMNEMLARIQSSHEAQSRFVGDASHELRSPLASMAAALEVGLARPELFDDTLARTTLMPEVERMRLLIDDLLLLARADERGLPHLATDVDLDDVVAAEVARQRGRSDTVEIIVQLEPVRTQGDSGQLSRAVRNLLDNAARYAATTVTVRLTQDADTARIEITDDGPGIPAEDRVHVFDRFFRLQRDRGRASGGTGLGLAIVAEIIAAHHGAVHFTDHRGGGAMVVITLPASP
ncbi:sensor histidine kinase [Nocardia acidivorans]|uniref:sensor histidine kinase n=1 Tax=Nocardia acidivorans TaxID=404580 RepID=UPI001FE102B1|nr:HAMP domain-containing sensor histidine kinase [Nocardia acidivorans]